MGTGYKANGTLYTDYSKSKYSQGIGFIAGIHLQMWESRNLSDYSSVDSSPTSFPFSFCIELTCFLKKEKILLTLIIPAFPIQLHPFLIFILFLSKEATNLGSVFKSTATECKSKVYFHCIFNLSCMIQDAPNWGIAGAKFFQSQIYPDYKDEE